MAFEYGDKRKETGVDVEMELPGGKEVTVTNVSYSQDVDTSEVQFNNSYTQDIAVTGVSYSGSFEIAGRDDETLVDLFVASSQVTGSSSSTALPEYLSSITFIDGGGREFTFENVMITSRSYDAPADDRTSASYDFVAENLTVGNESETNILAEYVNEA